MSLSEPPDPSATISRVLQICSLGQKQSRYVFRLSPDSVLIPYGFRGAVDNHTLNMLMEGVCESQ